MSPADKIQKMVNDLHVGASEKLDARVEESISNALAKQKSIQPAGKQLEIWRIVMDSKMVKLAAAAVIVIGAFIGINMLTGSNTTFVAGAEYVGPTTCELLDGSNVTLQEGAKITLYDSAEKRGFNHLTGEIVVDVEKGNGEFVVTTPYGEATALGTVFEMNLIDDVTANTKEKIEMLALKVTEGTVAVSNEHGKVLAEESHEVTMSKDTAPYNTAVDDSIPARVRERIEAMKKAFETGDPAAWAANFNMQAVLDLAKGKIADPSSHAWFGQMDPGDVANLQKGLADVSGIEELRERMLGQINIKEPMDVLVQSVKMSDDGKIVEAVCITTKGGGRIRTNPKWAHFEGDWWQIDD